MKIEKRDNVTILCPDFRLDAVNAPDMEKAVQQIAPAGGVKLLVDMEKTLHIDSSGLLALLRFQKALESYQGEMRIARAQPQVLNVIKLTGLDELFEIHDTLDNALKSFE